MNLHIGLIPDGNRRWAIKRGLKPWEGHWEGAKKIEKFIKWCLELGIKKISIYILSSENFRKRSEREIKELLKILEYYLKKWEKDDLFEKYEIKVKFLGEYRKLPKTIVNLMKIIMKKTAKHRKRVLNLLVNYGGTYEIIKAVRKIVKEAKKRKIIKITPKLLKNNLMVKDEVDLIIRTGGYSRLSNFLPLQSTYAEIYVTKKLWPDFTKNDVKKAIDWFRGVQRKFGR